MRGVDARRALVLLLSLVLVAIAPGGLATPGGATAAEGYSLATTARYDVRAADRRVDVTVEATFTNLTPNPSGQFSVFDEVQLAVHDGAAKVAASDGDGALTVKVARVKDVNIATVTLREGVRYQQKASFSLTYQLPDGGEPGLRVRPSVVVFPAWSFGTQGAVTVSLPGDYEVRTDGDPLTADREGDATLLSSGDISDPSRWVSLVIADRAGEMVTTRGSVPLEGGTVDLQVRSFADDEAWGTATAELVTKALPLLETQIGLPYDRSGPLVVTETFAVPGEQIIEPITAGQEIQVGFDQPPFTVVHQLAHAWITPALASERWIREGLASWAAGAVAKQLEIDTPYDPAARAEQLADVAFPLESWGVGVASADQDAFGYAMAWAFTDQLAATLSDDGLRQALWRIVGGRSPYQPGPVERPERGSVVPNPVDSRRLLDQLESVGSKEIAPLFGETVFSAEVEPELNARAEARTAWRDLLTAAGEWGTPQPVESAMTAWDFATARQRIDEARAWLTDRDALLGRIAAAGLSAPDRLRLAYQESGSGSEARNELDAEDGVVGAYEDALARANRERSIVERIGLLGAQDPDALLARANGRFAEGDLTAALDAAQQTRGLLDSAFTAGIVRILSAAALALLLLGAAIWLLRRRRAVAARPQPPSATPAGERPPDR